jgi:glycosyltransferase involved in cell wall biosynthesis
MTRNRTATPTVWVDVTTLIHWHGRWTGIPRTIGCILGEWMQSGGAPVRPCRYDGRKQEFFEVDPELMRKLFANQNRLTPPPPPAPRPRHNLATSLRAALGAAGARLPGHLQPALTDLYRSVMAVGRQTWRVTSELARLAKVAARRARPSACHWTAMHCAPGDVLLTAGGSWEQPGYYDVVGSLKAAAGVRVVPVVYDLIPHKFPQFFPHYFPPMFRAWLAELVREADQVVAISESTKRDLAVFSEERGLPSPPCAVIRLGDTPNPSARARVPRNWAERAAEPFVLSVGTIEIRKNHLLLYQVWRRLLEERGEAVPPLVMAGQRGWLSGDLQYQMHYDPQVQDRVVILDGLTDEELTWLYRHCLFTVYPSYYEGWGLPVAESLSHGKYCITSNTSSLPEIAGDLVGLHDPLDFTACKALVERALFDPGFRRACEERVRAHYRPTSWRDTAGRLRGILAEPAALGPELVAA